jgi:hypothetical protein
MVPSVGTRQQMPRECRKGGTNEREKIVKTWGKSPSVALTLCLKRKKKKVARSLSNRVFSRDDEIG